jgi:DNA-binding NarL/FixJ family response regulator
MAPSKSSSDRADRRLETAVGARVGYCPFVGAVVWGAPGLSADLIRAGFVLVDRCAARVALVRVEGARDLEILRALRGEFPDLPIVVMAESSEVAIVAIEAGSVGLVGNDASVQDVATAMFEAAAGGMYVAPTGAQLLVKALRARAATRVAFALTPRERDVLAELASGSTTQGIAAKLKLGHGTIQTHLKNIYRKLDVRSRAAATALALRHQLV